VCVIGSLTLRENNRLYYIDWRGSRSAESTATVGQARIDDQQKP